MFSHLFNFAAAAVTLLSTSTLEPRQSDTYPCVNGVFVLTVRATDYNSTDPNSINPNYKNVGTGIVQISNALVQKVGQGSYMRAVPYSACAKKEYPASTRQGVRITQSIIKDYCDRCKNVGNMTPRIFLLGYSQGAQVIDTAMMGGTVGSDSSELLPTLDAYQQYIAGGAIFGSPSYVSLIEPIDGGNSTRSGTDLHTAEDYAYFNATYGDRFRTYCTAGDRFCDNAGNSKAAQRIHLDEVPTYKVNATIFLLSLL